MPLDTWKSKTNYTVSGSKKKSKTNAGGYEHPSGMTSFDAILLILKQPGISPATKTLWIHLVISGWTTGKAYISEDKTPRAVGISIRKVRQAVTFLTVRGLINVERGHRAHIIRCNDALKRLADLPQALDWGKIHGGSSTCIRAQVEMQVDKTAEPWKTCSDSQRKMHDFCHEQPMETCRTLNEGTPVDPCKKCTVLDDEPMQNLHSTHAENAPQPCKICIQKETTKEIIKERTVTPTVDTDSLTQNKFSQMDYLRTDPEYFFSEYSDYPFDIHKELDKFERWLFDDPEAKDCNNVHEAWIAWLDKLVDATEASVSDDTDQDEIPDTSKSQIKDRIAQLAEIESNLDKWRDNHNVGGVSVYQEFPRFKTWLFDTPEGRIRQDVEKAFEEHLDRVWHEYLDAEDEPEQKFDYDYFVVGK